MLIQKKDDFLKYWTNLACYPKLTKDDFSIMTGLGASLHFIVFLPVMSIFSLRGRKSQGGDTQVCKLYRDVSPKWVLFSQEILRHGSTIQRKTLRHEFIFPKCSKCWVFAIQNFPNFRVFVMWNTQKFWKIGLYFKKILWNGYLFLAKMTLRKV